MITVIANLKGGTGKSTVNFNLAVWLAIKGHKVRLFDLDPQLTLTDVVEIRREEGYTPDIELDHTLQDLSPGSLDGVEALVDVGTSDMESMRQALAIADRIIVPVPPSQADVWSTQRFLKMIREIRGSGGALPDVLGFINRADTHVFVRETGETLEALEMLPGITPLKTKLYQRTAYRRSFSEGLSVFEMQPMSKAAREIYSLAGELYGSNLPQRKGKGGKG
ncbi:MAG: AAA family ATPase [Pseudomonadota bacterium]|nr:AAA family ATPase [Pseudomonadota bacterium]